MIKKLHGGLWNICSLLIVTLLVGCEEKSVYKDEEDKPDPEEIIDFSTVQDVQFNLTYDVPDGFRGKFEAYTENPLYADEYGNYLKKNGVQPFMSGYTQEDGSVDFSALLPAYASKVYVYSAMTGLPTLMSSEIANGKVKPVKTSAIVTSGFRTRASNKPYYSNWEKMSLSWKTLGTWNSEGKPADLLSPGITLGKEEMEIINATIPQGEKLEMIFCALDKIEVSEKAHVKLYYVSNGSSRRVNALAYYVYTDELPQVNIDQSQRWINKNLIMLYPNLSEGALQAGEGVQLKYYNKVDGKFEDEFPAGTKIGFALLVDAWKGEGNVASNTNVMYSYKAANNYILPDQIKGDRPQMALFKAKEKIILSFEDQPWTESPDSPYQGDFRDNVFVLDVDPIEALPDIPDGQNPDEPTGKPVNVYSNRGVMAFEDVWPYKGDYDMNDIVVKYKSGTYCDADWMITGTIDTFTFLHNGAQFENGFGYEMGVAKANIEKVEVISNYKCSGQGLDESLDKATVMLFDNGRNVPAGTVFVVKVFLKQSSSQIYGYTLAPYNPFITINGFLNSDRKEVHLVNYAPTTKADQDLLGYGHDLSLPEKGIYYVSDAKFPFAFNLCGAEEYVIPTEAHRIDEFYPDFNKWVASEQKEYTDWYLKPAN